MSHVATALQNLGFAICEAHDHCPVEVWARLNDADHTLRLALEAERGALAGIEADLVAARDQMAQRSLTHTDYAQESDDCRDPKGEGDLWRQSGAVLRQSAERVEEILVKHFPNSTPKAPRRGFRQCWRGDAAGEVRLTPPAPTQTASED